MSRKLRILTLWMSSFFWGFGKVIHSESKFISTQSEKKIISRFSNPQKPRQLLENIWISFNIISFCPNLTNGNFRTRSGILKNLRINQYLWTTPQFRKIQLPMHNILSSHFLLFYPDLNRRISVMENISIF